MSQITCRGRGAANASTKSHEPPVSLAASMSRRARTRTDSATAASVRGVNAFCTKRRSLVCLGSSMTMIDPTARYSGAGSLEMTPQADEKCCGLRLTACTSS